MWRSSFTWYIYPSVWKYIKIHTYIPKQNISEDRKEKERKCTITKRFKFGKNI